MSSVRREPRDGLLVLDQPRLASLPSPICPLTSRPCHRRTHLLRDGNISAFLLLFTALVILELFLFAEWPYTHPEPLAATARQEESHILGQEWCPEPLRHWTLFYPQEQPVRSTQMPPLKDKEAQHQRDEILCLK